MVYILPVVADVGVTGDGTNSTGDVRDGGDGVVFIVLL